MNHAELIPEMWTRGGTVVTNFSLDRKRWYERAIKEYGDPLLVIGPPTTRGIKSDLGLHHLGMPSDLSRFWRVFDAVKDRLLLELPDALTAEIVLEDVLDADVIA